MNSNMTVWGQVAYWNGLSSRVENRSSEDLRSKIASYEERKQMPLIERIKDYFQRGPVISKDEYEVSKRVLEGRLEV